MRLERHETESAVWEIARRDPPPLLRPLLLRGAEGWTQARGDAPAMREVPFPGIPLILNLGPAWEVDGQRRLHSFTAGMGTAPSTVRGEADWACIELRLTPQGAHRLFAVPMHEIANRAVELYDLVPEVHELEARLRDTSRWADRFDLVDAFLLRRLSASRPADPGVAWSWRHLYSTSGRAPIGPMTSELGWSHRRLIARYREQIGLTPKAVARVIRFDRAVSALRGPAGLAEIAYDCGYTDQAHLTREFRELAGLSPNRFRAALGDTGAVAAS
jgi:AraC-like DNA-binding protein